MKRYILECIKSETNDMEQKVANRIMLGLTTDFSNAHWCMEQLKKDYDVILIHELHSLDEVVEGHLS